MQIGRINELYSPGIADSMAGADHPQTEPVMLSEDCLVLPDEHSTLGLVELLLKNPARVDRLNRDPVNQRLLFGKFLLVAEAAYVAFALVMLLILNTARAEAWPHSVFLEMPPAFWSDGTAWSLPLAYTLGLVLASCICLPTFYFYSMLAGLRMSWLQVTAQIARGKAAGGVMLLGVLPIYVASVMGMIVLEVDAEPLQWVLKAGLLLPFVAGLWGLRAMYNGVMALTDTMPELDRCRRECFLRRMMLSWAAVYAIVSPVMIYRLWEMFAHALGGA